MNKRFADAIAPGKVALAVFLLSLALASIALLAFRNFQQDDAYISMRYAANLLAGNGIVWNPGERVEGYTNFLFIMTAAFLGRLGVDLVQAARMLGFIAYFALMGVLLRIMWKETPKGVARDQGNSLALILLPLGVTLASIPLAAWSLSGMETIPFALLATAATAASAGVLPRDAAPKASQGIYPGLLLAIATLLRPEGGLLFVVTFLYFAHITFVSRTRPGEGGGRFIIFFGAAFFSVVGPYLMWKYLYYGSLIPNTFHAKVSGLDPFFRLGKGLEYALAYALSPPWMILFAGVLSVVGLGLDRTRSSLRLQYFGLVAMVYFCYVTVVGGDFMPHFRFFAPLIPILALIIHEALVILAEHRRWGVIRVAALLLLISIVLPYFHVDTRPESASALTAEAVAPYIRGHWPRGSLVAVNVAGALPYLTPEFRYIDMLGMNDLHIAKRRVTDPRLSIGHLKGDGSYVLKRKPAYVLFAFPYGADVPMPIYPTDRELFMNDTFRRLYQRESVWIEVPPDLYSKLEVITERHPQVKLRGGRMLFVYHRRL